MGSGSLGKVFGSPQFWGPVVSSPSRNPKPQTLNTRFRIYYHYIGFGGGSFLILNLEF